MAKEEKQFVGQVRSQAEKATAVKKWETTLKRDGRWDKGWRVKTVHRGGTNWWIYVYHK